VCPVEAARRQAPSDPSVLRRLAQGICRCTGQPARQSRGRCSITPDVPIRRPDLAIYSQLSELAAGNVPSWDSPDITTNMWRPFRLMDQARVRIRNLSTDVPAMNALVHYFLSPFGIATPRRLFQSRMVSLAAGAEVELLFPLDAETLQGDPRVGVHITIEHPHDANLLNNAGSQVHDGAFTTEAGRSHSIQIPVLNDTAMTRIMQLSVLPTDILATVSPSTHTFLPHEQIVATLQIEVPGFLSGTTSSPIARHVTVVARLPDGTLVGGATRLLRIDS
jgi:hypothetical protein